MCCIPHVATFEAALRRYSAPTVKVGDRLYDVTMPDGAVKRFNLYDYPIRATDSAPIQADQHLGILIAEHAAVKAPVRR